MTAALAALSHLRRRDARSAVSDVGSRGLHRGLPLSERFTAQGPKCLSGDQVALDVEGVVDDGASGKEPLGRTRSLEVDPRSFPSARRLVRILGSIVEAPAAHMSIGHADFPERGSIWPELVSHDRRGSNALLPEDAPHQLQGSRLVTSLPHKGFQHVTLGVDRLPEIHHRALTETKTSSRCQSSQRRGRTVS